jgi:hypothetical protein
MTDEKKRPAAAGAERAAEKKKALAAALRANIQRRKARERALQDKPHDEAAPQTATDEATWTK